LRHEAATDEIQELAALYALGSLSQYEARSFEIHLHEGCSCCEAELKRFENIAAVIGLGAPEAAPPEYLRDLLAARIDRESRHEAPFKVSPAGVSKDALPEIKAASTAKPAAPRPVFTPPPPERASYLPWALAAALGVATALAFYSWKQGETVNIQLQQKVVSAEGDAENLRTLLSVQQEKSRKLEEITAILSSRGPKVIPLVGQGAEAPALSLFWDIQHNHCLIIGTLPQPPEGKVFQLWFVEANQRVSAGLLQADPDGKVLMFVDLPQVMTRMDAALITLEPVGGSKQPSAPILAVGRAG
jgi:anti-sigma-K factor RskA